LPQAASNNRFALYVGLNFAFLLVVAFAYGMGGSQNPRLLYLILMFALCSTSVIDLDGLNGRYVLLGLFLATYFVMFGLGDLNALVQGPMTETSTALLSETEAVILVGGTILVLSYRSVLSISSAMGRSSTSRDWSMSAILPIGCLLWAIGTYATYSWYVYIVTDNTNETFRRALQSLNVYAKSAYILAQMMQPLGILLIAYVWRVYRLRLLLALVLIVVALQVMLGFVLDSKGLALTGGALVIVTCIFLDGRFPKAWLVGAVAYVILVYPIFVAARAEVHGTRSISRAAIVENFGKALQLAIAAKERVTTGSQREMTFWERLSLRISVQTFVEKTGTVAPYQHGHTLAPLLATFLPQIIWADKPDIPTGQLFNKEFHMTDSEDTFLSPSQLGELYWNFGWSGVVVGMAIIGAALGFVGGRFNLAEGKTVTRRLVTVLTIKQIVLSFEGAIAPSYVVWMRSLAGIGVLHLMFARQPIGPRWAKDAEHDQSQLASASSVRVKAFPNLLS
jgi:hypothetical protein